jgi:hypothetical protein
MLLGPAKANGDKLGGHRLDLPRHFLDQTGDLV